LEWLAQEVREAGGTVTLWTARPASKEFERSLVNAMKQAIGEEYQQVIAEADSAAAQPEAVRGRSLARLRREMRRIRSRDYFQGADRKRAAAAVERLA
jgi:predicted nuclease of restriction endonuclease-like RecB superfamily